jgi:peptidoglycan hydrolase-like protein with peptidoglycan-binding domain
VEAGTDKDGWYGDHTARAVRSYQEDNKLNGDGAMNAPTFAAIFKGDPNVEIVIDLN